MQKRNPSMSSLEAAALILSQGATTDVEQAELMAEGKILDPDALERAYYRRIFGFDMNVEIDEKRHKAYVRDMDLGLLTTCTYTDDDNANAKRLSKACIKLKAMHDAKVEYAED